MSTIASMKDYSITLPSWSVGEHVLDKLESVAARYGSAAVVIGGKKAMAVIGDEIRAAAGRAVTILDFRWYGGEASRENIEALKKDDSVRRADMIFAVGGGKALDTCKVLGMETGKTVIAFPTIASTCAACTAVSILYHPDGSFAGPCFLPAPPAHTFIYTPVIARAPWRYLWAGLGDTYAKYFESTMSSRGDELNHYHALGVSVSRMCLDPLLKSGSRAMEDHRKGLVSDELEQVILTIIVNTAIASILLTADHIIDYNTGLAHAIFYALTSFPDLPVEREHLHGEVVGFGVLVLLLVDGQKDMFDTMLSFNRSVGLPTRLADIGVAREDLSAVLPAVLKMHDIDHNPYPVTIEMLEKAFDTLEKA